MQHFMLTSRRVSASRGRRGRRSRTSDTTPWRRRADQGLKIERPANILIFEERPDRCSILAVGELVDFEIGRCAAAGARHGEVEDRVE